MLIAMPSDIRVGNTVTPELFGTNMMFHKNGVGADGTFDEVADALGAGSIRYPGGAITEQLFDITNPNATTAIDPTTGDIVPIEPLSDVAEWAIASGRAMTLVLPTRTYLTTETDANGNRFAAVDETALRDFVTKLVSGEFGAVQIDGLEIGNEYWGIGNFDQGSMTSVEYGRVASRMVEILDDTLATVPGGEDVSILMQMGTNYGAACLTHDYADVPTGEPLLQAVSQDLGLDLPDSVLRGSGTLDWGAVNNLILIDELTESGAIDKVDGVIAHVYSRYPVAPSSRHWQLDLIEKTWGEAHPGIETWVTEWSRKAATDAFEKTEDYGLKTANELIDVMGFLADYEVEQAFIWTAQHNTKTTLARMTDADDSSPVELTAAGEAFRMMQAALPGLSVLDLAPMDRSTNATELAGIDLHAFANGDRFVMYLANSTTDTQDFTLDLSALMEGYDSVSITRLGVAAGQNPADPRSKAVVTENPDDMTVQGTEIAGALGGLELLEVVIERPGYGDAFGDALDAATMPLDPALMLGAAMSSDMRGDFGADRDGTSGESGDTQASDAPAARAPAPGEMASDDDLLTSYMPPLIAADPVSPENVETADAADEDPIADDDDGGGFGAMLFGLLLPVLAAIGGLGGMAAM